MKMSRMPGMVSNLKTSRIQGTCGIRHRHGPSMLACQHGSAYRGEGAALLRQLAAILDGSG
jgi:hypothetical protein